MEVVLSDPEGIPGLEGWLRAMNVQWPSEAVALRAVPGPGPVFDDGVLSVEAVPTRHIARGRKPSHAYVFRAEGKTVVATGDLSGDFSDFPEPARRTPCDLCLCEITHYPPEAAVPVLDKCPIWRLVFYHVHNPWHGEEGETRARRAFASLPLPFDIAHDGDEFEV